MAQLFINHTNHPSAKWEAAERLAAERYGEIVDRPFPRIPSDADEVSVRQLAAQAAAEIVAAGPAAVLCQGESTYEFALVSRLLEAGVTVLAATSERRVTEVELSDGSTERVSRFVFARFRAYGV